MLIIGTMVSHSYSLNSVATILQNGFAITLPFATALFLGNLYCCCTGLFRHYLNAESFSHFWRVVLQRNMFFVNLIGCALAIMISWLLANSCWPAESLGSHGVVIFVATVLPMVIASCKLNIAKDIRITERLAWSWSKPVKVSKLLIAFSVVAFIWLFVVTHDNILFSILAFLIVAVLYIWPLLFLSVGISTAVRQVDMTSDYAWRSALMNAGLIGFGMFGLCLFWFLLFFRPVDILFAALSGIVIAFSYGIEDVIKHYTLRLFIHRNAYAPLKLNRFLDHCVKLVFLRKVGSGYIFIHRLLLEHFAAIWEQEQSGATASVRSRPDIPAPI